MENNMNQQDRDLLIRLDTKLDNLAKEIGKDISELKGMMTSFDTRLRTVEIKQTEVETLKTELETQKDEINRLRVSSNYKEIGITIGTIIATVISIAAMYAK